MLITLEVIALLSSSLVHPSHHIHQCSELGPSELTFDVLHHGFVDTEKLVEAARRIYVT